MNLTETHRILAVIATLDQRVRAWTSQQAEAASAMWTRHLFDVPADWVLAYVEHYYRQADTRELTSGMVLSAYRTWERRDESQQASDERRREALDEDIIIGMAPPWFREYEQACTDAGNWPMVYAISDRKLRRQAIKEARERVAAVPVPPQARLNQPLTHTEIRERQCINRRICACDHHGCRGGFLDGDQVVIRSGRTYIESVRCPLCADAAAMVGESRPAPKGSRARHGARL